MGSRPVVYRAREEEPARPAYPRVPAAGRSSRRRPPPAAAFPPENRIATRDPSLEAQANGGRRRPAMAVTTDEDAANLEFPARERDASHQGQGRRDVIVTDRGRSHPSPVGMMDRLGSITFFRSSLFVFVLSP